MVYPLKKLRQLVYCKHDWRYSCPMEFNTSCDPRMTPSWRVYDAMRTCSKCDKKQEREYVTILPRVSYGFFDNWLDTDKDKPSFISYYIRNRRTIRRRLQTNNDNDNNLL